MVRDGSGGGQIRQNRPDRGGFSLGFSAIAAARGSNTLGPFCLVLGSYLIIAGVFERTRLYVKIDELTRAHAVAAAAASQVGSAEALHASTVPYRCSEVFRVNRNHASPRWIEGTGGAKALVVDDFYADPDGVRQLLLGGGGAGIWKDAPDARNFRDYWDCRTAIVCNSWQDWGRPAGLLAAKLEALAKAHFPSTPAPLEFDPYMLEFNMFRSNSTRKAGFQSFPHVDFQRGEQGIAALVYLNTAEEASGGTQFYKVKRGTRELDDRDEAKDTMVDVTGYEVLLSLPMRYNRLVLYTGAYHHGAWFDKASDAIYDRFWRITQVAFLFPARE